MDPMKHILDFAPSVGAVVVVLAVLALLAKAFKSAFRNGGDAPDAFGAVGNLFSPAERSFFSILVGAVGSQYTVFAKVRLADVVKVVDARDKSAWWRAFNKISAKHLDFVVCDSSSSAIVCCIELDDVSYGRDDRKTRDQFLERTLAQACVPLLRVPARRSYVPQQIRESFLAKIS